MNEILNCKYCQTKYELVEDRSYCSVKCRVKSKKCSQRYKKSEKYKLYCKKYNKEYAKKHRKQLSADAAIRRGNNLPRYRKYDKEYRLKYHSIPHNKIAHYLRTRLRIVLKSNKKSKTTEKLIGCSFKFLKYYLQYKFKLGMSWDNYGKWHIDHIRPCASFDLSKAEEQSKCFNYTNLQPLWAKENLRKGSRYE